MRIKNYSGYVFRALLTSFYTKIYSYFYRMNANEFIVFDITLDELAIIAVILRKDII